MKNTFGIRTFQNSFDSKSKHKIEPLCNTDYILTDKKKILKYKPLEK